MQEPVQVPQRPSDWINVAVACSCFVATLIVMWTASHWLEAGERGRRPTNIDARWESSSEEAPR